MSAASMVEPTEVSAADPRAVWLRSVLDEALASVTADHQVTDAGRIDRISLYEQARAVIAAAQAAECVRFAQSQVAEQMAAKVHPRAIGRGIADQIGLACRLSPFVASRRLNAARALWFDLPKVYAKLCVGEVSEQVAEIVVSETRHLDAVTRRRVDGQIVAAGIGTFGVREATACVRSHAYQADRHGYVARGRTERKHRRVGLRAARDTMTILTGYLPVEQGVACLAALRKHTDSTVAAGDERTRDQIMADTLVERLTGQTTAEDVNIELQITMPIDALTDPASNRTATVAGYGPLPADLARDILMTGQGRRWWRRLFTAPTGHLIGGDPHRRRFDGWLAKLITFRDHTCRDPYCDAPIRQIDHIHRHTDGGPTTLPNGRGVCARGNLVREIPGWQVTLISPGLSYTSPHRVRVTTPTGHHYESQAPEPP